MVANTDKLDIACAILAGGASRRFGSPKGLALLDGRPLVDHVADALKAQVRGAVVLNAPAAGVYADAGFTCIEDRLAGGTGPLAGIHAAMRWAQSLGHSVVLTAPVDTPFLPGDLVSRLHAAGAPAVARSLDRIHGVCGYWPVSAADNIEAYVASGQRKVETWVRSIGAASVDFPVQDGRDPFFNINTRSDADLASNGAAE